MDRPRDSASLFRFDIVLSPNLFGYVSIDVGHPPRNVARDVACLVDTLQVDVHTSSDTFENA